MSDSDEPFSGLRAYLREVEQYPLLTRAEENAIARRSEKGDKAAQEKLVLHNLRLVIKIANDYGRLGCDVMDLIQEGNIGLRTAAKKFRLKHKAKFSTYAALWIKQKIMRCVDNTAHTVRLPTAAGGQERRFAKIRTTLEARLGRLPTEDEMQAATGYNARKVAKLSGHKAVQMLHLEAPFGDEQEDGFTLAATLTDESGVLPVAGLESAERQAALREVMATLKGKEVDILRQRFGFDGPPKTLEVVSQQYRVTCERIRQIEFAALGKMRAAFWRKQKAEERLIPKKV